MVSFLVYCLAFVGLVTVIVLAVAFLLDDGDAAERVRIEMEVRRAERRLHDIARSSFQAMLDEARAHDRTRRS